MAERITDRDLKKLFQDRLKDRKQARSKRRIKGESAPRSVSQILPDYFGDSPNTLQKIEETRALICWEKYVGVAAAQHSKAIRLRAGTLTVKVSDPLWMQQLSLLKQELLRHYRNEFPKLQIQNIFFTR